MKVEIVEARLDHLFEVIEEMRDFERVRCKRLFGDNLEQEATRILARSILAYAGLVDGKCVVVWGVFTAGVLAEDGYAWLLGSKFLEDHPLIFLRHSRRQLADLRTTFSRLYGAISIEHDCGSSKWLEWLGFKMGPAEGDIRAFVTE